MHGVNEARVKLWIDALRSGEWQQTINVLELVDDDGTKRHCCLGVAQHIALRNGFSSTSLLNIDWGAAGMNVRIGQWYGFDRSDSSDPLLVVPSDGDVGTVTTCVEANDRKHWTFDQIADALEARYITPSGS